MSSASAADGLLINKTSCCDVWLEQRPAYPSVKEAPQSIRAEAPNSGAHSGHFIMGDFKPGDERRMRLYSFGKSEMMRFVPPLYLSFKYKAPTSRLETRKS